MGGKRRECGVLEDLVVVTELLGGAAALERAAGVALHSPWRRTGSAVGEAVDDDEDARANV